MQHTNNTYEIVVGVNICFKQNEKKLFFVKAEVVGVINVCDGFDKKLLNNMVAIMYSYLRPMVAQMTVMAKLPPLDLQPLSFEDFEVKVNQKQDMDREYSNNNASQSKTD